MRIAAHPIILTIIIFFLFLQPAARSIINGRLAEWSMAAVLKTVERQRSGGSNPSPSAKRNTAGRVATGCFWLQARRKPAFVRAGRQKRPAGQLGQQLYSVLHSPAAGGEGCRRAPARRNPFTRDARAPAKNSKAPGNQVLYFVWMTGLEPATSWSLTRCATNCATSRFAFRAANI